MIASKIEALSIPVAEIRRIKAGEDWQDQEGKIYKNSELTLDPAKEFSYAYCTDTLPVKHMHRYFKDVDLLYHEATFAESERERAEKTNHSTAKQAAEIAEITKAKYLLLGHFSARYREFGTLLEEAKSIFPLSFEAREGFVFSLDRNRLELKAKREKEH